MAYWRMCYAHRVPLMPWLLVILRIKGYQYKLEKATVQWILRMLSRSIVGSSTRAGLFLFSEHQLSSTPICLFCSQESLFSQTQAVSTHVAFVKSFPFGCSPSILEAFSLSSLFPQEEQVQVHANSLERYCSRATPGAPDGKEGESGENSQPPPLFYLLSPTHPAKCSLVSSAGGSHPCLSLLQQFPSWDKWALKRFPRF